MYEIRTSGKQQSHTPPRLDECIECEGVLNNETTASLELNVALVQRV